MGFFIFLRFRDREYVPSVTQASGEIMVKPFYFVVAALTWCMTWFMLGLLGFSIGAYAGLRVIALIRSSHSYIVILAILVATVALYLMHVFARAHLLAGKQNACPGRRCCVKSRIAEIQEREANE